MSKVNLSDLIDEIDREDLYPSNSKSVLKSRLDSISKQSKIIPFGSSAYKASERQAAYKVSSSDVSKWQETIKTNRAASQIDLTQPLPPLPTLEQIVTDLENSGFRGEINKSLNIDPQTEQETSLRSKLRSDQFHSYLKQKRTAKIKSKLYHKIRNKRKDKKLSQEDLAEEEELKRIEERVSLRHSAAKLKKTVGKYLKEDGKKIISENEALRQRIRNVSRVNDEGKVVYDSSSDEEFLAEQIGLDKGIMGMKFMVEAEKRQRGEDIAQGLLSDLQARFKFDGQDAPKKKQKKKEEKNEEQEKIIEKAFELDEMDQVAAEEWEREMQEKAEKLPKTRQGWGSWFGGGIKEKKEVKVPVHRIDKVIKNEERDKRASKFLVKKIPFPFKTSRQFDSVNKVPVGKEWNSNRVYQKQIAPEVLTKDGEVIDPIN